MCYVLPWRFRDGLRVRVSEWVIGDWPVVYNMCNGVDEDPLSLGQAEDDGVVLRGDDGGFLAINDPGRLVTVFSKQDRHVFQWVDWGALGHGCTWNSGERTLILEEMHHDDVIDALRTSSGHGHDGGRIFRHECLPDVIVGQVTLGTQDHVMLDAVQLLLGGLSVPDQVQELAVLLVHYPELLVQEVFHDIGCMEGGGVIYYGGGCGNTPSYGLQRLLLMFVTSKDYHRPQV